MATLKVYHTASPSNAVYKSLGTAVTLSTDIVLPPSFDLYGDALRVISDTAADNRWNYAELSVVPAAGTWYYFIDRIEYLGGAETDGAGYTLHLRVDPLMTWQSDILGASLFVARNEFDFDKSIPDAQLPQYYFTNRTPLTGYGDVANPSDPCIVVHTASKSGYLINVMTPDEYVSASDALWGLNWQQLFYNQTEVVIKVFMLPYPKSAIGSAFGLNPYSRNNIPVGGGAIQPADYNGLCVSAGEIQTTKPIHITSIELPRTGDDWRNKGDMYKLYVPYCGWIDLAANEIYHSSNESVDKRVYIKYVLDIITGEVTVEMNPDPSSNQHIHYLPGNMGIPIPISGANTTQRFLSGITGLVTATAGGALATMESLGAGLSVAAMGATQMTNALHESTTISGTFGSTSSWGLTQKIYGFYIGEAYGDYGLGYARTYGKPLYQPRLGSVVSGYTICQNVRIQPSTANAAAAMQIKNILESGVYFDNGL